MFLAKMLVLEKDNGNEKYHTTDRDVPYGSLPIRKVFKKYCNFI